MHMEKTMSTQDDKQHPKGRSWDQITKDGTSSAGSMGVGGTGDSGKLSRQGSQQSATRTDDLLDDGSSQENQKGFVSGGELQTGLEGIGNLTGGAKGNRQSSQQGSQGARLTDEGRDDDPASRGQQNR